MKKVLLFTFGALLMHAALFSQQLEWTGDAKNNDFFDETNWKDATSHVSPDQGTLDAGVEITANLLLKNAVEKVNANGTIKLAATAELIIQSSHLIADGLSGGNCIIKQDGYVDLLEADPLKNGVNIQLLSGIGWVRTFKLGGRTVYNQYLSKIKVNEKPAVYKTNLRLDNYYLEGTVIRSKTADTAPLILFDGLNLQGASANITENVVHSGGNIPAQMNDKTKSFILKKGFMVTLGTELSGIGKSKNYIASESDLEIDTLPDYLLNDVSFIRVVPWNWVTKKGNNNTNDREIELNSTWRYKWSNSGASNIEFEYAPMSFSKGGTTDANITKYLAMYNVTHIMGFNESDNCDDQGGTGGVCVIDAAVGYYKNLMKSGLRMVSPSCRENAPFGWLKDFYDVATEQDVRIDVIGVHWYDWGSNPKNSPNENPQLVFNRFKNYLNRVHDLYNLPIWITEFNANPNRTHDVNLAFMKLALPYLESLDYIERYCWFQPNGGAADFYDANNVITDVGIFYSQQISNPSVAGQTVTADSNTDVWHNRLPPISDGLLLNGDFELASTDGWMGTNIGVTSNCYEGAVAGRILSQAGEIYQEVNVVSGKTYKLSFYSKWYVTPPGAIDVKVLSLPSGEIIASQTMTESTSWNLVELSFTVPANVTSVKILIEKETGYPGWFLDSAVLSEVTGTGVAYNFETITPVVVQPNPSAGQIIISAPVPFHAYKVYSATGKLLRSEEHASTKSKSVDLSDLKNGFYFVVLQTDRDKMIQQKVLIKT